MFSEQYPKALVIDDVALVSVLIEDILRARGYEVTVVNTRSQLLEATAHHHVALACGRKCLRISNPSCTD